MNAVQQTAKEILQRIKSVFDAPVAPTPSVDTTAPSDTTTPGTNQVYKLKDGTEISICIDDPSISMLPDAGDIVTIAGNPAPEGDYELEDGTKLTVDATGAITLVTPALPITKTPEEMAANADVKKAVQPMTLEDIKALMSSFATGTPEDRITNLEIMVKALMECNFGYKIREGQEDEAVNIYKQSLTPVQNSLAKQDKELQAATQRITKQDEVIKGLFELTEKLVELPSDEPKTLTGAKKERFDKANAKEKKFEKIANAISDLKNKNKNPANQ